MPDGKAGRTSPPRQPRPGASVKKLTEEQRGAAVTRLYDDSLKHIQVQKEQLTRRVYLGEAEPKTISAEQLQDSIARQHDAEMERRQRKAEELRQRYYADAEPKTLPPDDIETSVQRIYSDAVKHQDDTRKRLEAKYTFKRKAFRKLNPDEEKESCTRLAKPHKHDYTDAEVNKILGL
eukprot:TRINITY_DN5284_c1_g3_i1.p2 TRINITY_DN5284_c1_g3~~TRINITY_DN5284_c1_g3_i1.p2  ORF type:complete len:178 (+),score=65.78 TRINITY_DN5284_c1_g3_i1:59-592(+)